MAPRLIEMFVEARFEVGVRRGLRHFGQRLEELIFGVVEIFQFLNDACVQGG